MQLPTKSNQIKSSSTFLYKKNLKFLVWAFSKPKTNIHTHTHTSLEEEEEETK